MASQEGCWPIQRKWLVRGTDDAQERVPTIGLAKHRAACLLGAAGIGKSWEIETLADYEESLGRDTYRVSLGRAATSAQDLRKQLDAAVDAVGEDGAVFLDALDEAMVPMRQAALVVEAWAKERLQHKPHLRIACRSAVWPRILASAINSLYTEDECISAELDAFTESDIRAIARSEDLDTDGFVQAIYTADAMPLAQQPLTLKLLITEFRSAKQLPSSRRELFSRGILRLCTERSERLERGTASQIAPNVIVNTAERLAVYSVTSGRDVIDLRDDPPPDEQALHWIELSGLPTSEAALGSDLLRAVAATGLFVCEGDQCFRFQHRQFAEFLAGRRIGKLPWHQARALLAGDAGWSDGVAGPLRETAAVAASVNYDIAEWIATTDPEVIGRSDVADHSIRRNATVGLLDLFRRHKLTDSQLSRDHISFAGLKYPQADADLRRILRERGDELEDLHACAIELTESWRLSSLSAELADMVLDDALPEQTREDAGYALLRIGTDEAKRRLLPLIHETDEQKEDIKGLALRCNWPHNLDDTDLLQVLGEPQRKSHFGAYAGFLAKLEHEGFAADGHRIAGLQWAQAHLAPLGSFSRLQGIVARIVIMAAKELDQPDVLHEFVKIVVQDSRDFDSLISRQQDEDLAQAMEDVQFRLAEGAELRRSILDVFALQPEDAFCVAQATRRVPGLLELSDFEWLLSRALNESRPMADRERYASFASWLPWEETPRHVDAWLAAREHEPVKSVLNYPLYVDVNSKAAQRAREAYQRSLKRNEQVDEPHGLPDHERIASVLERSLDDPRWFAELVDELAREEGRSSYSLERFVTVTAGWADVGEETKATILERARCLLDSCDDLPLRARKAALNSIFGDGGMAAMFLLLQEDRKWLEQRDDDWWNRWSWYVMRELHPNLHGEPDAPKHELITLLHSRAPDSVREHLIRLARRKDGSDLLSSLLSMLIEVSDVDLDTAFCELIRGKSVRSDSLSHSMEFVLQRVPQASVPVCSARLSTNSRNDPSSPAVRAAVRLLEYCPAESWEKLIEFMEKRLDLARHAIGKFAYHERRHGMMVDALGAERVGQFVSLMFRAYPPEADPLHKGAYRVTDVDAAIRLRGDLLNWLMNASSQDAVNALRRLEHEYGAKYTWLRRPRAKAERRLRLTQWVPLPLQSVAEILHNSELRLLRSVQDVVDGIMAALHRYNDRLRQRSDTALEGAWNTPYKQRPSPKDEEYVSGIVCGEIRKVFAEFAVAAAREVQVARRLVSKKYGGKPGSEVDIFVDVPAKGTATGDRIVVLVEVKRSCNSEAKTGLRKQLIDRYMQEVSADRGIFVVAFFDAPNLANHHKPQWQNIDEASNDLKEQADQQRWETAGTLLVDSFVLDARLAITAGGRTRSRRRPRS